MPDIHSKLGREVLVVEGAMGTMLQRAGIGPGQCLEQLNLTAPDVVIDIHRQYQLAGADCAVTNTFCGTRAKLDEYGLGDMVTEFSRAGVRLAREAGAAYVLGGVGSSGLVMEPLGKVSFDVMFDIFAEQACALVQEAPDAILIETMTDLAEARCALLAARSVCDLPVFVTMTFGVTGLSDLSATPPEVAAVVLEACGASAVGLNCGIGPEQMLPVLEKMVAATDLPIIIQPNAGLPKLVDGKTIFPGTADEMARFAEKFVDTGAAVVGSCCGSTPSFTRAIADVVSGRTVAGREAPEGLALASARRVVRIGYWHPVAVIGERINPTGKKLLAESLREGSMSVVREYAIEQEHDGADLLDVNVGATGVDEVEVLRSAVMALATMSDAPLVIDNTDPIAVEAALKTYPGRVLLNSVNGSEESMEALLPLAARYGAAVLVLCLHAEGIPATAKGRLAVAERVRARALEEGLVDRDLAVDCLVLTAATDGAAAGVTLETLRRVSQEWGLATVLGVSNVSHGLPGRPTLNATFLQMATEAGLSAAIVNPLDLHITGTPAAIDVLTGRDENAERWIALTQVEREPDESVDTTTVEDPTVAVRADRRLARAIETGDKDSAPGLVDQVIADGMGPQDVIADILTPTIQRLGDAFAKSEVFLPQLMISADAMKVAVTQAKTHLPPGSDHFAGKVVFATVQGDVHSIGKDICVSLLESSGYEVEDLGVDVPSERVVEAAKDCDIVCLSALMTTTVRAMRETVDAVKTQTTVPVVVGGAVVTIDLAESLGAGYADDAPACVRVVGDAIEAGKGGAR